MSDIYLELKSRIPVVAAQTHIGTARLQEAQDAVGLSNESIARLVPVSEKTWRRWKEAGQIPTYALPAVAKALRLELKPDRPALEVLDGGGGDTLEDRLERVVASLGALETAQAEALTILRELKEAVGGRAPARPKRKAR